MKKLLLAFFMAIVMALPAMAQVAIDETNFPDAAFRSWVKNYDISPKDNILTEDEITEQYTLSIIADVTNLCGVKYFKQITSVSWSQSNLQKLDISGQTSVRTMEVYQNALTELNVAGCTSLERLVAGSNNNLTSVNVSGCTSLKQLNLDTNGMTEIDVTGLSALEGLSIYKNELKELDLTGCDNIQRLNLYDNCFPFLNLEDTKQAIRLYTEENRQVVDYGLVDYSDGISFDGMIMSKVSNLSGAVIEDGKFKPKFAKEKKCIIMGGRIAVLSQLYKNTATYYFASPNRITVECVVTSEDKNGITLDGVYYPYYNLGTIKYDYAVDPQRSEGKLNVYISYAFNPQQGKPTDIQNIESEKAKTIKTIENGRVVIIKGDKKWDLTGREL